MIDELLFLLQSVQQLLDRRLPLLLGAFDIGLEKAHQPVVEQVVNIRKMIIKRVGADFTVPRERGDRDLIKRHLPEHLLKMLHDRIFRELLHKQAPFRNSF